MSDRYPNDSKNHGLNTQSPNDKNNHPEGTTVGDPAVNEAGLDKVMSRVEGNEKLEGKGDSVHAPPKRENRQG